LHFVASKLDLEIHAAAATLKSTVADFNHFTLGGLPDGFT
jgi:hypothetical protein